MYVFFGNFMLLCLYETTVQSLQKDLLKRTICSDQDLNIPLHWHVLDVFLCILDVFALTASCIGQKLTCRISELLFGVKLMVTHCSVFVVAISVLLNKAFSFDTITRLQWLFNYLIYKNGMNFIGLQNCHDMRFYLGVARLHFKIEFSLQWTLTAFFQCCTD